MNDLLAPIQAETDEANRRLYVESSMGEIPVNLDAQVTEYANFIKEYDAAIRAGKLEEAQLTRDRCDQYLRVIHGGVAIKDVRDPDAPGNRFPILTAAKEGKVPLWGQTGKFLIQVEGVAAWVQQDGLMSIGISPYLHFSISPENWRAPFFSESGYYSFFPHWAPPEWMGTDFSCDEYAAYCIGEWFHIGWGGRLVPIKPEFVPGSPEREAYLAKLRDRWDD